MDVFASSPGLEICSSMYHERRIRLMLAELGQPIRLNGWRGMGIWGWRTSIEPRSPAAVYRLEATGETMLPELAVCGPGGPEPDSAAYRTGLGT